MISGRQFVGKNLPGKILGISAIGNRVGEIIGLNLSRGGKLDLIFKTIAK
ncbi:MAG: hypothetical protein WBM86_02415 [Waterburya sp.]